MIVPPGSADVPGLSMVRGRLPGVAASAPRSAASEGAWLVPRRPGEALVPLGNTRRPRLAPGRWWAAVRPGGVWGPGGAWMRGGAWGPGCEAWSTAHASLSPRPARAERWRRELVGLAASESPGPWQGKQARRGGEDAPRARCWGAHGGRWALPKA